MHFLQAAKVLRTGRNKVLLSGAGISLVLGNGKVVYAGSGMQFEHVIGETWKLLILHAW